MLPLMEWMGELAMPIIVAIVAYRLWSRWYGNSSITADCGGMYIVFIRPAPWGDTKMPCVAMNWNCCLNEPPEPRMMLQDAGDGDTG